jgi:hypothetical protein
MSAEILSLAAARARLSPETKAKLLAFQVTETTALHAPQRVARYARRERWQRTGFGRVEICLIGAALVTGALLRWLA